MTNRVLARADRDRAISANVAQSGQLGVRCLAACDRSFESSFVVSSSVGERISHTHKLSLPPHPVKGREQDLLAEVGIMGEALSDLVFKPCPQRQERVREQEVIGVIFIPV